MEEHPLSALNYHKYETFYYDGLLLHPSFLDTILYFHLIISVPVNEWDASFIRYFASKVIFYEGIVLNWDKANYRTYVDGILLKSSASTTAIAMHCTNKEVTRLCNM